MKNHFTALFIDIILIALLTANFCGCLKRDRHGLTIKKGVLSVGVEIGYPPMEYYDTDGITLLGFDIELTNALAEKLGLKINFIDTAWEGILAGLDANRYDIALNVTILPERQKNYNFTKPYINSSIIYAAVKNRYIQFDKPEYIAGRRVGYQGDTTAQYHIEKFEKQGYKLASFSYDKIIYCFNDLLLGRLDLAVADNITASHYVNKIDSSFEVVWEGPLNEHIGICLKKGNDELTAALDGALDELFADGVIQEISKKIFDRDLISGVFSDTINNNYE